MECRSLRQVIAEEKLQETQTDFRNMKAELNRKMEEQNKKTEELKKNTEEQNRKMTEELNKMTEELNKFKMLTESKENYRELVQINVNKFKRLVCGNTWPTEGSLVTVVTALLSPGNNAASPIKDQHRQQFVKVKRLLSDGGIDDVSEYARVIHKEYHERNMEVHDTPSRKLETFAAKGRAEMLQQLQCLVHDGHTDQRSLILAVDGYLSLASSGSDAPSIRRT